MYDFSFIIKENVMFCFQSKSNNLISELRDWNFHILVWTTGKLIYKNMKKVF